MLSKLVLAALACVVLTAAAAASAAAGHRVFYLKVTPRQCLIGGPFARRKKLGRAPTRARR